MARYRRVQERKIQRQSLDNPDELVKSMERYVDNISFETIGLTKQYSKKTGCDKYQELSGISNRSDLTKDGIRVLLGNIKELQHQLRVTTDEAIQSNIEAKMYKNMLGGRLKDTKINIGKIIRKRDEQNR